MVCDIGPNRWYAGLRGRDQGRRSACWRPRSEDHHPAEVASAEHLDEIQWVITGGLLSRSSSFRSTRAATRPERHANLMPDGGSSLLSASNVWWRACAQAAKPSASGVRDSSVRGQDAKGQRDPGCSDFTATVTVSPWNSRLKSPVRERSWLSRRVSFRMRGSANTVRCSLCWARRLMRAARTMGRSEVVHLLGPPGAKHT